MCGCDRSSFHPPNNYVLIINSFIKGKLAKIAAAKRNYQLLVSRQWTLRYEKQDEKEDQIKKAINEYVKRTNKQIGVN